MNKLLLIGTQTGLVTCKQENGHWIEVQRDLAIRRVTSIIAREGVIMAGTESGVFRSSDQGQSWEEASLGLDNPYVRWLAYHPETSDLEFAGTEPAGIYISKDGGDHWHSCPEVEKYRDENGWFLPYSPRAGCVRGFAFHGNRGYAAVEVGGVLISDDKGETWRLAEGIGAENSGSKSNGNKASGDKASGDDNRIEEAKPPQAEEFVHSDVHDILVHPSSEEVVLAPTGGGLYRSLDGGRQWEWLYTCYCRAAWINPEDKKHIIFGPADGVDRRGRIEESQDGGQTWKNASTGLHTPWEDYMVERFVQIDQDLFAVLSNGEIIMGSLQTLKWRKILTGIKGALVMAVMENGSF
jgi:photosystem II stability/assembly factor-like uncharacterized protein